MLFMKNHRPGLIALAALGLASLVSAQEAKVQPGAKPASPAQGQQLMAQKSARFIENAGQWNRDALYMAQAGQMNMWITSKGVSYDFFKASVKNGQMGAFGQVVKMSFANANSSTSTGRNNVRFDNRYVNSVTGSSKIANGFAEVLQKGLYNGIDAHYYFDKKMPRYDLIVAPGADPKKIGMTFTGASSVKVKGDDILLETNVGEQRNGKLYAYQTVNGRRVEVPAKFVSTGKNSVAISVGSYDKTQKLVIDPLIYGSYYGGNSGWDDVRAVTSDTSGGTYMTGYTRSAQFPAIAGPYGFSLFGGADGFITKLQGDAFAHDYAAIFGGSGNDFPSFIDVDPFGDIWVSGTTNSPNFPGGNLLYLKMTSTGAPKKGTFTISYPNVGTTVPLPYNASSADVKSALKALLGTSKITVDNQLGAGSRLNNGGVYKIILPAEFSATPTVDSSLIVPATTYTFTARQQAIFFMRWAQSSSDVLTPFPQAISYFAGESPITLASFKIVPNDNPTADEPVRLTIAGDQSGDDQNTDIADTPRAGTLNGYIGRIEFDRTSRQFARVDALTKFVKSNGQADIDLTGMDVDRFGSIYTGGTVFFDGNVDTSTNPVFQTTSGVYNTAEFKGRLLRKNDMFARKYTSNGNISYSCLIGGNGNDGAGGYDFDPVGNTVNTGSILAVDDSLNVYITGVAGSFNYPRTRGVFGPVPPNDNPVIVVTKLNPDASQIVYSTNLRSNGGNISPAGIAVDSRGNAFITGNAHSTFMTFPDTFSSNPEDAGDPNEPDGDNHGSIFTTADAFDPDWITPDLPELTTSEAWLSVLNDSATDLLYSSYIGGILDDRAYAPYVDKFGDVWISGFIDTHRLYFVFSSQGVPTVHDTSAQLPDTLITPLAFKRFPDNGGNEVGLDIWFGIWSTFVNPFYMPFSWPASTDPPGSPIPTIGASFQRDGYILKQRVGLTSVDTITLDPSTAPGGLGVTINGVITLSQPAPVGGASVELTLDTPSAALFTNGSATTSIDIASGATTGTFQILTQPVQSNTNVQVKATYQGSFKVAQFVVKPWLQDLSLSPNSVVGGNNSTGRITLAAPAPAGGVTVNLTTDNPTIVSFPGGATVNVPEGQASVVFAISTSGVTETTFPTVRASLLDKGITRTLTLTQASLKSLTFAPSRVAGGTTTVGTIALDGAAGSAFTVKLNINGGTSGYKFPKTLTFNAGESSKTFNLVTAYEPVNTSRVVTVTRPAQGTYTKQSVKATIFVDFVGLSSFTIAPTTISAGEKATGTVTISSPAPAGGVVVKLKSSDSKAVTIPNQVIVPAGASVGSFEILAKTTALDSTVTITASRGPKDLTKTVLVKGVTFTLAIDPTSVIGGVGNATGTLTISSPAPLGGVTFNLSSSIVNAKVPATVTVPKGATSVTFAITTTSVSSTKVAHISAKLGATTQKADLEIRAIGLAGITVNPSTIAGGGTVTITVSLEAALETSATVHLSATNAALFESLPGSITIPAGQTSKSITVKTVRVTRDLSTDITATYGSSASTTTLTVTR